MRGHFSTFRRHVFFILCTATDTGSEYFAARLYGMSTCAVAFAGAPSGRSFFRRYRILTPLYGVTLPACSSLRRRIITLPKGRPFQGPSVEGAWPLEWSPLCHWNK